MIIIKQTNDINNDVAFNAPINITKYLRRWDITYSWIFQRIFLAMDNDDRMFQHSGCKRYNE